MCLLSICLVDLCNLLFKQRTRYNEISRKVSIELTEYKGPREVTIQKLQRDHLELWNELIKESNGSSSDAFSAVKGLLSFKQLSEANTGLSKGFIAKLQNEVCELCVNFFL